MSQEEQEVKATEEEEPLEAEAATAAATNDGGGNEYVEEPPTAVLICLGGGIHFEHSGEKDVMAVKILNKDELPSSLEAAREEIQKNYPEYMLEAVHVIITASSIPVIFDAKVVSTFVFAMKEDAEITFHVLRNGENKPPVEPADVDEIRYALCGEDGLDLTVESIAGDGDWVITAKRNEWDVQEEGEEEGEETS
mmetsp:Transcript_1105/g.1522  ORF Transcript_1105/g.1522 Transcript_1105/m.1522 type:complete len:195 (-) Transcript_1105:117-701(-)